MEENDERTIIVEEYDDSNETKGVSIVKPLLAVVGLAAAGIGGFIFYKKRKKSKYAELTDEDVREIARRDEDEGNE